MAVIREELILVDRFTTAFTRYIQIAERAARTSRDMRDSLLNIETATAATAQLLKQLIEEVRRLSDQLGNGGRRGRDFGDSMRGAAGSANILTGALSRLLSVYTAFRAVKWAVGMSDTLTGINARLGMMNDGLQTTAELQDMLYQSAMRSRGSYTDTAAFAAKLGLLAGDAFGNNAELIAFAEVLNKQMAISGAGTQEKSAALLQLQQALSSGVLRGDELRSVMENAPLVAQTIAKYMGVSTGKMRELASEGKVTAEIVKNAMLQAADETNERFAATPRTWGQAWTQFQNEAVRALEPLFEVISELADSQFVDDFISAAAGGLNLLGQAAQFASDHAEDILGVMRELAPVVGTAAAMFLAYKIAMAVVTAQQWLLNAAMAANPIGIVIALIVGLIIAIIYLWDNCEWFRNAFLGSVRQNAKAFLWFYNDVVVPVWNALVPVLNQTGTAFLDLAEIIVNAFSAAGKFFVENMDFMLGSLRSSLELYNQIAGTFGWKKVNVDYALSTEGMEAARQYALDGINKARGFSLDELDYLNEDKFMALFDQKLQEAGDFRFSGLLDKYINGESGRGAGRRGAGGIPYDELMDLLNGIDGSVKDAGKTAAKAVDMTQEDLKEMIDVAERRYVNNVNLTAQTPVITVNGANTGRTAADRQNLADTIRDILIEQTASGAVRTTARTF